MKTYDLHVRCEDGGSKSRVIRAASQADAERQADSLASDWLREGDWGVDGAVVRVRWELFEEAKEGDEDREPVAENSLEVEIDPDHAALIRQAVGRYGEQAERCCGTDPDDHDWTAEGEGGCDSNPGVHSHGGTCMSYRTHCRTCGLRRREVHLGSQRNPGECDSTEYTMPDSWCAECEREECSCEREESEV